MHKLHASPNSVFFSLEKEWLEEVTRRKRAKSAPSTAPSVASSGSKPSNICRACTFGGSLDKKFMDNDWHASCFNATVKCRHRTMKEGTATEDASETLVQADKDKLKTNPNQWSALVQPFLPAAPASERRPAMASLKSDATSFQVTENVDEENEDTTDLVMRLRHFQRHWKKWENSDSENGPL